jgi:hypothetical protein
MYRAPNDFGSLRRHVWALPLTLLMTIGIVTTYLAGHYPHMAIAIFLVISSTLPLLIERFWRVRLPTFIQVSYVAFLFLSMYSGEVLGMYSRFFNWDYKNKFI